LRSTRGKQRLIRVFGAFTNSDQALATEKELQITGTGVNSIRTIAFPEIDGLASQGF
jgi:hypothetical protein